MGSLYEFISPVNDLFFQIMLTDADIEHSRTKKSMRDMCTHIFRNYMNSKTDVVYLDFDVNYGRDKNHIIVTSNNIITSLWFSGIRVDNCGEVLRKNTCYVENRVYKYNKKTKKLTYTIRK